MYCPQTVIVLTTRKGMEAPRQIVEGTSLMTVDTKVMMVVIRVMTALISPEMVHIRVTPVVIKVKVVAKVMMISISPIRMYIICIQVMEMA